jgi:hypothetical protein
MYSSPQSYDLDAFKHFKNMQLSLLKYTRYVHVLQIL